MLSRREAEMASVGIRCPQPPQATFQFHAPLVLITRDCHSLAWVTFHTTEPLFHLSLSTMNMWARGGWSSLAYA